MFGSENWLTEDNFDCYKWLGYNITIIGNVHKHLDTYIKEFNEIMSFFNDTNSEGNQIGIYDGRI